MSQQRGKCMTCLRDVVLHHNSPWLAELEGIRKGKHMFQLVAIAYLRKRNQHNIILENITDKTADNLVFTSDH